MPLRTYHKHRRVACCPFSLGGPHCTCYSRTTGVPLTFGRIKCSLELVFSIVNFNHGTNGPATTRSRSTCHARTLRRLLYSEARLRTILAFLARISPYHPFFCRGLLVPQDAGLRRPR